jgi:hypothetical protein
MGKHTSASGRRPLKEIDRSPHAVWRGIGCFMILLIPIMSIALAYETINYGIENKWPIPYQLLGFPKMPKIIYDVPAFSQLTYPIRQVDNFYAYTLTTIAYMIVIGGIISVLYALVYRVIGPSRYGPFDAPPPKIKTKRYTR